MFSFLHPCRIIRLKTCYDKPFNYFYKDVWNEYAYPDSKEFPMFKHGPYRLFAFLIVWLIFIHLVLEKLMKLRSEPFNFRPLLLVFNSFQFVINFIGLIIGLVVTNFGISLWTCTFRVEDEQRGLMLRLGFIYLITKLFELLRPVLSVIRGHTPHKLDTFGQIAFIILFYKGFLFFPFGVHAYMIIADTLYHTIVYVYLIFSCTGTGPMKPVKFKKYMPLLNMFKYGSMFLHATVTFIDCDNGYYYLKLVAVLYTLFGFICATCYMVDIVDKEDERRKQLKED